MSKRAFRAVVLGAIIALLGIASFAVAGGGKNNVKGHLSGYQENPDVSTAAKGTFKADIVDGDTKIAYELTYSGLEGSIQQSHIHFGKSGVNGGVSLWLCGTPGANAGPAGTQTCPTTPGTGTITGNLVASNVVGPGAQGIDPGELAEIIAAIRAGHAYANVHTTKVPSGEIRAQIRDNGKGDHEGKDGKHDD